MKLSGLKHPQSYCLLQFGGLTELKWWGRVVLLLCVLGLQSSGDSHIRHPRRHTPMASKHCRLSAGSSVGAADWHTYMTSPCGLGFQYCSWVLRGNVPDVSTPSGTKTKAVYPLRDQVWPLCNLPFTILCGFSSYRGGPDSGGKTHFCFIGRVTYNVWPSPTNQEVGREGMQI